MNDPVLPKNWTADKGGNISHHISAVHTQSGYIRFNVSPATLRQIADYKEFHKIPEERFIVRKRADDTKDEGWWVLDDQHFRITMARFPRKQDADEYARFLNETERP